MKRETGIMLTSFGLAGLTASAMIMGSNDKKTIQVIAGVSAIFLIAGVAGLFFKSKEEVTTKN